MMSKRKGSKGKWTLKLSILVMMAISMAMATLFLFFLIFVDTNTVSESVVAMEIKEACNTTRYPTECESSLRRVLNPNPSPLQIIQCAISVSNSSLLIARSKVNSIVDPSNQTLSIAAKSCLQVLHYSYHRISQASHALSNGKTNDARAWLSASLGYHYGCYNGLKYVNHTPKVAETISYLESLTILSSNALTLTLSYHLFGNHTVSWRPPITERNGFWEPSSVTLDQGLRLGPKLPSSNLTPNVTVCKSNSSCDYATVQEAVRASPDRGQNRFVIYIKEGVYEERVRVPFRKTNLVFFGDGIGKTVITGSANVAQLGMTTYNSATVGVSGDGFIAKNLTIQNTAGPNAHQAVAFRSDSDLSIIENCEFIGNQDTLYAHSLRQFYKSCRIIGNVDFIFGNSAAIFQDCKILVRPRQDKPEKGENNAITAHGRTDPAQSTGFVFQNCTVNGTEEYMALYYSKPKVHMNYLGRPWKEYSRTIFIHSLLEALITPQGWMPWSGDFALNTLYYGEFENSGPGSNLTQRVPWSNQVPAEHVFSYSVQTFIQGDDWNNHLYWN